MTKLNHYIRAAKLNNVLKKTNKKDDYKAMDEILVLLLRAMQLYFSISKEYRKNIENFEAGIAFEEANKPIVSVTFSEGKMKVTKEKIDNPNVTIYFKDGETIKEFLFSESPDIISLMLANKLSYIGNINYIMKFAYMATHVRVLAEGKAAVSKLPKKNSKLTNEFRNGKPVKLDELQHEYYVEIITGFIPNVIRFSHRKKYYLRNGKPYGNNILFKDYNFGYFSMEKDYIAIKGDDEKLDVLILNYHNKRNFIWRGMIDQIRCLEYQKLYLGRYNLHFFGKLRFVGYFALTLKKQ